MTKGQIDHGVKLLSLLDEATNELILLQAIGDYINLSTARAKLDSAIAEIEDIFYPHNSDIEAATLRNDGLEGKNENMHGL